MKLVLPLFTLLSLVSCGKKIETRDQAVPKQRTFKQHLTSRELWSIHSESLLPKKVKVVINEMEFVNECTGLGRTSVQRTERNGTINIESSAAFRQKYFDIDITDCETGAVFYSEDYVDQTEIIHPSGNEWTKIVLRLRN